MITTAIIVNIIGLIIIAWIVWYFWLWQNQAVTAQTGIGGMQQVEITVKGGYQPAAIVVKAGHPLRLNFTRRESSTCGEEVLLSGFGKRVYLPENKTVTIDIAPQQAGEYEFTCGMNMYRGKLIVE
ncbi:MAG: cupredoxin domain-containing protein [Acidobacteriota bacterium]